MKRSQWLNRARKFQEWLKTQPVLDEETVSLLTKLYVNEEMRKWETQKRNSRKASKR